MKRFITFIVVTVMVVCVKQADTIQPLPAFNDRWEVRAGNYADKPIFIRINRGLDSIAKHAPLSYQAAASVSLKYPLESGLSDENELIALKRIEKMLTYRLVATGLAVHGLEVQSDGRYDFIYYTENKDAVEKVFGHIKVLVTDYNIDFSIKRDKRWITYKWFSTL